MVVEFGGLKEGRDGAACGDEGGEIALSDDLGTGFAEVGNGDGEFCVGAVFDEAVAEDIAQECGDLVAAEEAREAGEVGEHAEAAQETAPFEEGLGHSAFEKEFVDFAGGEAGGEESAHEGA